MKRKICVLAFLVSLFVMLGIVGGVEHGGSILNMLWCVPALMVMCVSIKIGISKD